MGQMRIREKCSLTEEMSRRLTAVLRSMSELNDTIGRIPNGDSEQQHVRHRNFERVLS